MALEPSLKLKVDELFLAWCSEPTTQAMLRSNLNQLFRGEPITKPPSVLYLADKPGNHCCLAYTGNESLKKSNQTSTPPNLLPSPASPRHRQQIKSVPKQWIKVTPVKSDTSYFQESNLITRIKKDEGIMPSGSFSYDSVLKSRGNKKGNTLSNNWNEKQNSENKYTYIVKPLEPEINNAVLLIDTVNQKRINEENIKSPTSTPIMDLEDNLHDSHNITHSSILSTQDNNISFKDIKNNNIPNTLADILLTSCGDQSIVSSKVNEVIPQFYFPSGKDTISKEEIEACEKILTEEYLSIEGNNIELNHMPILIKAIGLPLYWKQLFYNYVFRIMGSVTKQTFMQLWKQLKQSPLDDAATFVKITSQKNLDYLEFDDFIPLVQDVIDNHPGLIFLQSAKDFHLRYIQTVISRIFYVVDRNWSGKISARELRQSNFLKTVEILEEENEINAIVDYFSYEHFYVIYCKFWEIDKDHDLLISRDDLLKHNDHAISSRMVDRIFSGAVTKNLVDGQMTYRDFVWFLISEEDKQNPRSIEYWFRCMDLDGDGIISMYEMEYFYEEQCEKMEALGIETLLFKDCLCQMLDMINPQDGLNIRLRDLKSNILTPIFFDTFFNLDKYLDHEQRDIVPSVKDGPKLSDWDRYAAEEYEALINGEANDQEDDISEDDTSVDSITPREKNTLSEVESSLKRIGISQEI